jgi:hypothetical protein
VEGVEKVFWWKRVVLKRGGGRKGVFLVGKGVFKKRKRCFGGKGCF